MRRFIDVCGLFLFAGAAAAIAPVADAQCSTWDVAIGSPGTDGAIESFAVVDDGSGPALYAAGSFTSAGGNPVASIARWDGASWSAVGAIDGTPQRLFAFDDGTGEALHAGVRRFNSGILSYEAFVARWDGTAWNQVGTAFPTYIVRAFASFDAGSGPRLHVAMDSTTGQGTHATVRVFDGVSWALLATFGSPFNAGQVFALATFDDQSGDALYAAGFFSEFDAGTAGGGPAFSIVRYDGAAWSTIGGLGYTTGPWPGTVRALTVVDDGARAALYVAGIFDYADGVGPGIVLAQNVVRWNGTVWSALGAGVAGGTAPVLALSGFDDGSGEKLYVGGMLESAGGNPVSGIASWDGASWSALGAGVTGSVAAFAVFDDGEDGDVDLYVGGELASAGGLSTEYVARWTGCATSAFCFGDGSGAACPCGNSGQLGGGCDNSIATGGALLSASGTSHPDGLVLTSSGELPSALSIFLQGDLAIAPLIFGDGLRCAGGSLKRLYVQNAVAGTASAPEAGDPSITQRSAALGDPIALGSARYYQVYYRDPDLAFCPSGGSFNASNALRVVW